MSLPPEILLRIIDEVINDDLFRLLDKMSTGFEEGVTRLFPFSIIEAPSGCQRRILSSVPLSHSSSFFLAEMPKSYIRRARVPEIVAFENYDLGGVNILMDWAWDRASRKPSYLDHVRSSGLPVEVICFVFGLFEGESNEACYPQVRQLRLESKHEAVEQQGEGITEA